MRIEYLEEFEALATVLNYSKVARTFHLSTSVLSRHITSLEKEVGDQLFARDTTSVALTPVGQRFFEGIVPVLDQYRSFRREFECDPLRTQRQIRVTLLRQSGILKKTASRTAQRLTKQEGISVVYTVSPAQNARDDFSPLLDGRADAVITYDSSHIPAAFAKTLLHTDPFVAVVPVEHPLAQRSSVSLVRDLSRYKTVFLKSAAFQAGINVIEDAFEKHGVTPLPSYFFAQSQDELCFSPTFEDVLPVPQSALPRHPYISPETHVVLPFEEDLSFSLVLIYPQQNASAALEAFARELKAACDECQRSEPSLVPPPTDRDGTRASRGAA